MSQRASVKIFDQRTWQAFLIAPFCAVVLVSPACFALGLQFIAGFLLALIFIYGGSFLLGIPAYYFLVTRGYTKFWMSPVAGFLISCVTWVIFMMSFSLMLGGELSMPLKGISMTDVAVICTWIGISGVVGAVVGSVLWWIARPDRQRVQLENAELI